MNEASFPAEVRRNPGNHPLMNPLIGLLNKITRPKEASIEQDPRTGIYTINKDVVHCGQIVTGRITVGRFHTDFGLRGGLPTTIHMPDRNIPITEVQDAICIAPGDNENIVYIALANGYSSSYKSGDLATTAAQSVLAATRRIAPDYAGNIMNPELVNQVLDEVGTATMHYQAYTGADTTLQVYRVSQDTRGNMITQGWEIGERDLRQNHFIYDGSQKPLRQYHYVAGTYNFLNEYMTGDRGGLQSALRNRATHVGTLGRTVEYEISSNPKTVLTTANRFNFYAYEEHAADPADYCKALTYNAGQMINDASFAVISAF